MSDDQRAHRSKLLEERRHKRQVMNSIWIICTSLSDLRLRRSDPNGTIKMRRKMWDCSSTNPGYSKKTLLKRLHTAQTIRDGVVGHILNTHRTYLKLILIASTWASSRKLVQSFPAQLLVVAMLALASTNLAALVAAWSTRSGGSTSWGSILPILLFYMHFNDISQQRMSPPKGTGLVLLNEDFHKNLYIVI